MNLFDAIVVGSGPAGVWSAHALRPLKILMLDVGYKAGASTLPAANLYELRRGGADVFKELIGDQFESLHNLDHRYRSPKLKGPLWKFLNERPQSLASDAEDSFDAVLSYARGGLANAWGAGVLRYNDDDLRGFPVSAADLAPYYDRLTREIGVNGANDDLASYFGSTNDLQEPLPASPLSKRLLEKYERAKGKLRPQGVTIGRTRAAIITKDHVRRKKYQCFGQDFFQPNVGAIYHPGYTLDELVNRGEVEYLPQRLVRTFDEEDGSVCVSTENLQTGNIEQFRARKLFLAAGALNTARIVLESRRDYHTKLPLLDNPVSFIPFICPWHIGDALPVHSFLGGELIVVYEDNNGGYPIQASFYGLGGPLRTDLLSEFPLPLKSSLAATKYLLPALSMLQVFYPDDPSPDNYLRLRQNGSLDLRHVQGTSRPIERVLIRTMRSLGFYSSVRLCKFPKPGSSIHYAGALPMRLAPMGDYESDPSGRLAKTRNVHICDGANFPRLPSKNHTFTIMANAMRIAEMAKSELRLTLA